MNKILYGVVGALLLFGILELVGCDKTERDKQSTQSFAVSIEGSGLLARGLMDDKKGFAWVPVTGPRIQEHDEKMRDDWMKSLWQDWSKQFPNKEIFVMSPVAEKGEIYGVTIKYEMR